MISDKQLQEIEAGADQLIAQGFLSPARRDQHIADQTKVVESLSAKEETPKKKNKKNGKKE